MHWAEDLVLREAIREELNAALRREAIGSAPSFAALQKATEAERCAIELIGRALSAGYHLAEDPALMEAVCLLQSARDRGPDWQREVDAALKRADELLARVAV